MGSTTQTSGTSGFGPVRFPPTRWTLVLEARDDPERAERAMRDLCERYRDAIEAWFRLHRPEEAGDLAHRFIERWLERNRLQHIEQRPGLRFRFYLANALGNFLKDHYRHESAAKRGGGAQTRSVEELQEGGFEIPGTDARQPAALDCALSLSVHAQVMDSLCKAAKDQGRFDALTRFVPFELDEQSYNATAAELQISPGALRVAISRLRDDYFEAFRSQVVQMTRVEAAAEADEETRYLLEILPASLERRNHASS